MINLTAGITSLRQEREIIGVPRSSTASSSFSAIRSRAGGNRREEKKERKKGNTRALM